MQRKALADLTTWFNGSQRKPLVLRGARQVGKTWLVRHFAAERGLRLIELNFEKNSKHKTFFQSNDPKEILAHIEVELGVAIAIDHSLLFLDEIQAAPELLAKLRWFAEEMPGLAVIAAGSLLDFALAEHSFSMPVGRIGYYHLEPLSFEEFLLAKGNQPAFDFLQRYTLDQPIPEALHHKLLAYLKEYIIVGGMPAAVATIVNGEPWSALQTIQHDLLATYRDDFSKYAKRVPLDYLDAILTSVPQCLGEKWVHTRVSQTLQAATLKKALELLVKARVISTVQATAANGVPLAAEVHEKFFKVIGLDVGLISASLGLHCNHLADIHNSTWVNQGGISEQLAGQLLRSLFPFYQEPKLYYWLRTTPGSNAEVDYVIQHQTQVIPIEVKAGSTGTLKSLHLLMAKKQLPVAVRVSTQPPSLTPIDFKIHTGEQVHYQLLSIPFYLLGQLHRLLQRK